ncbi:Protein O-linked-mannose beta-1,2-N-acetylglucosaminyltransferase 1, partial [Armadillidium vulgare]
MGKFKVSPTLKYIFKFLCYFNSLSKQQNDPDLMPEPLPKLDIPNLCSSSEIEILVTSNRVQAKLNSHNIFNYRFSLPEDYVDEEEGEEEETEKRDERLMEEESNNEGGILLTSVNMQTCKTNFYGLFRTNQFGGFRQLNWVLNSLQQNRLVILASLNEGSILLNETSRDILSQFGSLWSHIYGYKDTWVYAFVTKGPTLTEVISPNIYPPMKKAAPIYASIRLAEATCLKWPDNERWNGRRYFCEKYDDFKDLCDCENPLVFSERQSQKIDPNKDIPVGIATSVNRSNYMYRLLKDLSQSKELTRDLILISLDEYDSVTAMIAFVLGIKTIYRRISEAAKFTLFNQLQLFPSAKNFIFLDDDILLAKDFYRFMQMVSPVLQMDKSLWVFV